MLVLAIARCSYPDFRYEETGDGQGGEGAGAGASSSSTGQPPPQVPCGEESMLCAPEQVCCFHETMASLDHCAPPGCGDGFGEFRCNGSEDCTPEAAICCAKDNELDDFIDIMTCQSTCEAVTELIICGGPADCPTGVCTPAAYPGYQTCR